jgi:hypothetical protein
MSCGAQPRWLRQVKADPTRLHDLERCIARLLSDPTIAEQVRERLARRITDAAAPAADLARYARACSPGDHEMLVGRTAFQSQDTPNPAPVACADHHVDHDQASR